MSTEIKDFKKELNKRIVEFSYIKKDGTIRDAKGTTCLDKVPEKLQPSGKERNYKEGNIRYYDVEKEGWRSFNEDCSDFSLKSNNKKDQKF